MLSATSESRGPTTVACILPTFHPNTISIDGVWASKESRQPLSGQPFHQEHGKVLFWYACHLLGMGDTSIRQQNHLYMIKDIAPASELLVRIFTPTIQVDYPYSRKLDPDTNIILSYQIFDRLPLRTELWRAQSNARTHRVTATSSRSSWQRRHRAAQS